MTLAAEPGARIILEAAAVVGARFALCAATGATITTAGALGAGCRLYARLSIERRGHDWAGAA